MSKHITSQKVWKNPSHTFDLKAKIIKKSLLLGTGILLGSVLYS